MILESTDGSPPILPMRSAFEYNVKFTDYVAALRRAGVRLARTTPASWLLRAFPLMSFAASLCATIPLVLLASERGRYTTNLALLSLGGVLAVILVVRVSFYVRTKVYLRRSLSDSGPVLGAQRLEIEADGLRFANASLESSARNASTSSGAGGRPVRSKVARRISVR